MNEKVLLKCQPTSDADLGILEKFMRPLEGPWLSQKLFHHHIMRYQTKKEKLEKPSIHKLKKKKVWGNQEIIQYIIKEYWLVTAIGVKEIFWFVFRVFYGIVAGKQLATLGAN